MYDLFIINWSSFGKKVKENIRSHYCLFIVFAPLGTAIASSGLESAVLWGGVLFIGPPSNIHFSIYPSVVWARRVSTTWLYH